jgi:hypothetical protein
LSSKEKLQSQTKLQDLLTTMTVNAATPYRLIELISMAMGHQKNGTRTLGHLHKIGAKEPLTKGLPRTVKEAAHQRAFDMWWLLPL